MKEIIGAVGMIERWWPVVILLAAPMVAAVGLGCLAVLIREIEVTERGER